MLSKAAVTVCAVAVGFAVKDSLIKHIPVPLKRKDPTISSTSSFDSQSQTDVTTASRGNQYDVISRKVTLPVTSDRIKRRIKQTRDLAKLLQSENTHLSLASKLNLETGLKDLEKLANRKPGTYVPAERFQDSLYHVDSFANDSFAASEEEEEEHRLGQLESLIVRFLRLILTAVCQSKDRKLVWVNELVILLSKFMTNNVEHRSEISEAMLQVSIGKILCSLTCDESYRKILLQNPSVIENLQIWKESNAAYLKLLGQKILWNLRNPDDWIPDGVYIWTGENQNPRSLDCGDIVFVHGLGGSAFYTWRQGGDRNQKFKTCWPIDWLMEDLNFQCRLIFLDYQSIRPQMTSSTNQNPASSANHNSMPLTNQNPVSATNQGPPSWTNETDEFHRIDGEKLETSIEFFARDFLEKLRKVPKFGQKPILFVCHSMGGLIVKQLLVNADEKQKLRSSVDTKLITNTQGFLFLSTPHLGSSIASKFSNLPPKWLTVSPTLSELSNVPKLFKLNYDFAKVMLKTDADCISVAESLPTKFRFGVSLVIVPVLSAYPGFGRVRIIKKDHLGLSKPSNKEDPVYELVTRFISEKPGFQCHHGYYVDDYDLRIRNKLLDLASLDLI